MATVLCLLLAGAPVLAEEDVLAPVLLTSAEAPANWALTDEQRAEDVAAVPEATAAVRQTWTYRGEAFTIVYFLCADLERAAALYARHARLLGRRAVVAPLGPIVVELHDAPSEVWSTAAVLLGLDEAQQAKLVAATLPAGWGLIEEFLSPPAAVAQAGAALGGPIQSVLVQELQSPNGRVRINYFLSAEPEAAARVYERVSRSTKELTFVTLQGALVLELLAEEREALLPALEILETAPLRQPPRAP